MRRSIICLLMGSMGAVSLNAQVWVTPPKSVASVELVRPNARNDFDPSRMGVLARSSTLLGHNVIDKNQGKLGTVEDMAIELPTGKILAVVVSHDQRRKVIPASALFPVSEDRVVFNEERSLLNAAPALESTGAGAQLTRELIAKAYEAFGKAPPEAHASATPPGTLAGMKNKLVVSGDNQPLGKVGDLVLDVPAGRVVYVLVNPEDRNAPLYAIPPQAFEESGTGLVIGKAREHVLAGPKLSRDFWTEVSLPDFASAVYSHYNVLSEAGPAIRQTLPEASLTPTGRDDDQIKKAFLAEIVRGRATPAANATDLNISVSGGKITLSGKVPNQKAMQELLSAASSVVGAANVENRLVVRD